MPPLPKVVFECRQHADGYDFIFKTGFALTGLPRYFISAYCEVEWRKRAERWDLVREWLISKGHEHEFHGHGFTQPGSRLLAECCNKVSDCKAHAWQWRAWGESK